MEKEQISKAARRRMKEAQRRARKRKRFVKSLRANKPCNRNDPCHCGSGKKFKKCCMRSDSQLYAENSRVAGTLRHPKAVPSTRKSMVRDIQKLMEHTFRDQEEGHVA